MSTSEEETETQIRDAVFDGVDLKASRAAWLIECLDAERARADFAMRELTQISERMKKREFAFVEDEVHDDGNVTVDLGDGDNGWGFPEGQVEHFAAVFDGVVCHHIRRVVPSPPGTIGWRIRSREDVPDADVHFAIDAWHENVTDGIGLEEWLGVTDAEYRVYVEGAFEEFVEAVRGRAPAAAPAPLPKLADIGDAARAALRSAPDEGPFEADARLGFANVDVACGGRIDVGVTSIVTMTAPTPWPPRTVEDERADVMAFLGLEAAKYDAAADMAREETSKTTLLHRAKACRIEAMHIANSAHVGAVAKKEPLPATEPEHEIAWHRAQIADNDEKQPRLRDLAMYDAADELAIASTRHRVAIQKLEASERGSEAKKGGG